MVKAKRVISAAMSVILATMCTLGIFVGSGQTFVSAAAPVSYFSLNQKDNTVKEAKQRITGKFNLKGQKAKVTYKVYSAIDEGNLSFQGKGTVKGETFTLDGLKLKPNANKIIVTAVTADGKIDVKTINIDYDSSKIKDATNNNVARVTPGSELLYVTNNLLVYFEENVNDQTRQAVIDTVGGKCVGYVNGINMWQVEVAPTSFNNLIKMAEQLTATDEVFYASFNLAQAAAPMATIPTDPWYSVAQNKGWTEINPEGANWNVEAVQAFSAWDYDWAFNHINVGIVDTGVQSDHEDLAGKIFFPDAASAAENNPTSNHGTHVAGIMGATPNNKGIAGILWDTNMYCVNWSVDGATDATLLAGLTETVQAGAKVVNFSLGLSTTSHIREQGAPDVNPWIINYARQCEAVMTPLLNAGYDFIVCESAGNGQYDSTLNANISVDAIYNGYFCCVTNTNLIGTPEMITKINERIIIVGSADRTDQVVFTQYRTSNAGTQVDICAPGFYVYSTVATTINSYDIMSGTSMASPMVAAIAALTWSVNPSLTGAQVRSMVLNPLNTPYTVADNTTVYHPLTNSYKMVNAKKSVEAALATIPPVYTAVNAAVSAANALDSSFYTADSWLELTTAVNAVKYDMLYKDQPQIDLMAQNINTAITNLVLKTSTVSFDLNGGIGTIPPPQTGNTGTLVTLPMQGDIAKQYYNFLGWATTQGASIALASYAIPTANATLYAVWSKIPVTIGIPSGSPAVVNQTNHFIYGLKTGLTQIEFERDYIKLNGNSRLEYSPDSEILGTNTRVDLIDNETLTIIECYYIVIFGDVNGDGNIDSLDAGIIVDFENKCMPWDPISDAAFIKAGDVNNEGNVDSIDAGLVVDTENSFMYINQVTGTATLIVKP